MYYIIQSHPRIPPGRDVIQIAQFLGPSWAMLGHLGNMLGHLGSILGHLGITLGYFGTILGHLGTISSHLWGGGGGDSGKFWRSWRVLVGLEEFWGQEIEEIVLAGSPPHPG